jgi:transposase
VICIYPFANRRANRIKILVHDGIGIWLASRRMNQGKFVWPNQDGPSVGISRTQFDALVSADTQPPPAS